jgi:hypothetical protein
MGLRKHLKTAKKCGISIGYKLRKEDIDQKKLQFIFCKMNENAPLRSKFAESENPEFMLISMLLRNL